MVKDMNDKLAWFREKYDRSRNAYTDLPAFDRRLAQFEGTKKIPGGRDAALVWNFTAELIESQVDTAIPQPRVRPQRPTRRTLRLAKVVEDMIRAQLDRLPFETFNDQDERMCRVMGGSAYLLEWDNSIKTRDTVGDLSVRLLLAPQVIPQQGVYETRYMDYLFLTFEDTKERVKLRYGVDVQDESIDSDTSFNGEADAGDERVTQVMCFYKNEDGVGCFSWAGDTVLIDDANYEMRQDEVCGRCGLGRPAGAKKCACGCGKWKRREKDFEVLTKDILDPQTGRVLIPARTRSLDARGNLHTVQTKIPYYTPGRFPVVLRRNISVPGHVLGASDCDMIRDFQLSSNKLLTRLNEKLLKAGSYLTKPSTLRFEFSDAQVTPINIDTPEQLAMLRSLDLQADVSQDLAMTSRYYEMARSVLGVTDSFQGKPDATASSGRAKQAQIAQSAGRQKSKRIMKNAAYADLFEMMFQFMLAYADEPRVYTSTDEAGEQIERVFSRYDFLEQDENGAWFYNDQFLFSVDESGVDAGDKLFMLEDLRTDLSIGAYGDPSDPQTMLAYWKEKEVFGYPNAARNVARWEKKAEQVH